MNGATTHPLMPRFPRISLEAAVMAFFAAWPMLSFLVLESAREGRHGGWEPPYDPYLYMLTIAVAAVSLFHIALRRRAWSLCVLAAVYLWFCAVPGQIAVASPAL